MPSPAHRQYPLKDIATISWLEQRSANLVEMHASFSKDKQVKIQNLGYTPIKAAKHFMGILKQVLTHPDPQSLLSRVETELGLPDDQSTENVAPPASGLLHSIGSFFSPTNLGKNPRYPDERALQEFNRQDLTMAVEFINDAFYVLQASSLIEGEKRIRDMYADWYTYTGNTFAMSLHFEFLKE